MLKIIKDKIKIGEEIASLLKKHGIQFDSVSVMVNDEYERMVITITNIEQQIWDEIRLLVPTDAYLYVDC